MFQHFKGSFFFALAAFAGLWYFTGSTTALFSAMVLSVMEVSLSFDNAIVNAKKLEDMNETWRKIFLTVGMLIAVGLVRVYFPIQIVSIVGDLSLGTAADLALTKPHEFAEVLHSTHHLVAGFGGAFLMMLFLKFFIDQEKELHWVSFIEPLLAKLDGKVEAIQVVVTLAVAWWVAGQYEHGQEFFNAAVVGVATYIVVDAIKAALEAFDEVLARGSFAALSGGLGAFLYLEVLDASFSFDGVIAAFALANNIYVVAAGLGVGAIFVRSMTMMLVEHGSLSEYRFLEHGAFWSIGALSLSMFIGLLVEIPEWVIAATSVVLVLGSLLHSILVNKRETLANA